MRKRTRRKRRSEKVETIAIERWRIRRRGRKRRRMRRGEKEGTIAIVRFPF